MEKKRKEKELFYLMKRVKGRGEYGLVVMIVWVRLLECLEKVGNGRVSYEWKEERKSEENRSLFDWKFVKDLGKN